MAHCKVRRYKFLIPVNSATSYVATSGGKPPHSQMVPATGGFCINRPNNCRGRATTLFAAFESQEGSA